MPAAEPSSPLGIGAVAAEPATPPASFAGPHRTEFLGGSIRAGRAVYQRLVHMGHEFAVLDGKSLNDKEFVFAIKKDRGSGREFFVHIPTKHKSWDLPDRSNPHAVAAIDIVLANPWRERFIAFYKQYNADKLPFVDPTLAQFPGRERVLMNALVRKYGPEPGHEDEYEGIMAEDAEEQPPASPAAVTSTPATEKADSAKANDAALRARVTRFVAHYKPSKATPSGIDKIMNKYAGLEAELIQFLIDKFGPEPPEPTGHECDVPSDTNNENNTTTTTPGEDERAPVLEEEVVGPAIDTSAAESTLLLREQSLMGFLQDREARLETALARNSDLTSELDQLRDRNETLINEARALRNQVELESKKVDGNITRLHHDAAVSQSTFELERTKLRQQLQEELLEARKRHGEEQVRHEQIVAEFAKEKSNLKATLSSTREELDNAMRRTSELITALDKRELANVELRRQNDRMTRKLNPERADSASQTDELGLVPGMIAHIYDNRIDPAFVDSHELVSRSRLAALENALHRARRECEQHASELHMVRSGTQARSVEYDLIAKSPSRTPRSLVVSPTGRLDRDAELTVADLKDKLSNAYATVSSLRAANKHLESRVGQLEMKLLSMPSVDLTPRTPARSAASPSRMIAAASQEADADMVDDAEETVVATLKEKLAASTSTIRVQKGEINDLRMLLARYMSYSANTPSRKTSSATPNKTSPASTSRKHVVSA